MRKGQTAIGERIPLVEYRVVWDQIVRHKMRRLISIDCNVKSRELRIGGRNKFISSVRARESFKQATNMCLVIAQTFSMAGYRISLEERALRA